MKLDMIERAKEIKSNFESFYQKKIWRYKKFDEIDKFSSSIKMRAKKDINFGAFVYDTANLGDNIQTIAQLGLIANSNSVLLIDRENVGRYEGSRRACIMNGWFAHNTEEWPPSKKIEPMFVSFHVADKRIVNGKNKKYYKKYEPIGCRDYSTVQKLDEVGIEAKFTGCLTLMLENPYSRLEKRDYVVVSDSHPGPDAYENSAPPNKSAPNMFKKLIPKKVQKDAVYVEHNVGPEAKKYAKKMERSLELLELYAKAKTVITSRLHCALPCIAMGVPVVFLHKEWDTEERFDGYRHMINGYGPKAKKIDIDWKAPTSSSSEKAKTRMKNFLSKKLEDRKNLEIYCEKQK